MEKRFGWLNAARQTMRLLTMLLPRQQHLLAVGGIPAAIPREADGMHSSGVSDTFAVQQKGQSLAIQVGDGMDGRIRRSG